MTFKSFTHFKDVSLPNGQSIPIHWSAMDFCTLAKEVSQTSMPYEDLLSVYLDRGVIPYSEGGGVVHKPSDSLEGYQLVLPGDFVMNNQQAWRGSVGVSKYRGIVSPAYLIFRLSRSLDQDFSNYQFRDRVFVDQMMLSSQGVGDIQRQVKWPLLRKIKVLVPPLDEQRSIVAYLDSAIARIDTLISKKTRFIELLRERRQELITRAVTRGLDESVAMKDGADGWLGQIPAHWNVVRLKHLIKGSLQYGAIESGDAELEEGPRYIRITDLDEHGNLRAEGVKRLSPEVAAPYMLEDGDILFARSGATVGKTYIHKSEAGKSCFAGYMIRARPNRQKIVPGFAIYSVRSNAYWAYIRLKTIQATIENVGAEKYGDFAMPTPPLIEQRAIAAYLDKATARIDKLTTKTERSIELLREHRSAIITAAVTGKIDLRKAA